MYGHNLSYDSSACTSWLGMVAPFLTVVIFVPHIGITLSNCTRTPSKLVLQGAESVNGMSHSVPYLLAILMQYKDSDGNNNKISWPITLVSIFFDEVIHAIIQKNGQCVLFSKHAASVSMMIFNFVWRKSMRTYSVLINITCQI